MTTGRLTQLDLVSSVRRLLREASETQSWLHRQECIEKADRRMGELERALREAQA